MESPPLANVNTFRDPSVRAYLREISRLPLLRPEQEIELARKIQAGRELKDRPDPTREERLTIKRGLKARETFVKHNLLLVVRVAKGYAKNRTSLTLLDLIQEGNIGLHRAVEKFDHARGYKFSTYAYWWIKQACQRAVAQDDLMISLPQSHQVLVARASKARWELSESLGRSPTPAEVAQSLDMDEATMTASLRRAAFVNSLDERVSNGDGEGATRGEMIEDLHHPSPAAVVEGVERAELATRLAEIINNDLGPRAREVLLARSAPMPATWKDLVKRTGLAKPILRQIESAAIAQCRRAMSLCGACRQNATEAVGEQLNILDLCILPES
jgi:RNA polymerase nonessential primary-like sigma factor